jgi:hypothetical protein
MSNAYTYGLEQFAPCDYVMQTTFTSWRHLNLSRQYRKDIAAMACALAFAPVNSSRHYRESTWVYERDLIVWC